MCFHNNLYAVLKLWGGSIPSYNNCHKIMGGWSPRSPPIPTPMKEKNKKWHPHLHCIGSCGCVVCGRSSYSLMEWEVATASYNLALREKSWICPCFVRMNLEDEASSPGRIIQKKIQFVIEFPELRYPLNPPWALNLHLSPLFWLCPLLIILVDPQSCQ